MQNKLIKYSIIVFVWASVLYPLWMRAMNTHWAWDSYILLTLFPFFGLAAFSLLWLHAISGVFEPWLRKQFDFDRFVSVTALLILICIIMHPLLLILSPQTRFTDLLLHGGLYIWLGIIGWLLLITYDVGKALKKHDFFVRNWDKILIISTIGFLLTFLHSLVLGDDLQVGPLRYIWIFYGVTATLATIYTYGIKLKRLQ